MNNIKIRETSAGNYYISRDRGKYPGSRQTKYQYLHSDGVWRNTTTVSAGRYTGCFKNTTKAKALLRALDLR